MKKPEFDSRRKTSILGSCYADDRNMYEVFKNIFPDDEISAALMKKIVFRIEHDYDCTTFVAEHVKTETDGEFDARKAEFEKSLDTWKKWYEKIGKRVAKKHLERQIAEMQEKLNNFDEEGK